jgi:hypothetical protein
MYYFLKGAKVKDDELPAIDLFFVEFLDFILLIKVKLPVRF